MAIHKPSPFGHVLDQRNIWELFNSLFGDPLGWDLPRFELFGYTFHLTKFMILELAAAVLIALIFIPLARTGQKRRLAQGQLVELFRVAADLRPQRDRPADHRRTRRRPVHAVPVDAVPVHPVLQPARPDPAARFADGQHLRHGRPGHHRLLRAARGRHRQDGRGQLLQVAVAAHRRALRRLVCSAASCSRSSSSARSSRAACWPCVFSPTCSPATWCWR